MADRRRLTWLVAAALLLLGAGALLSLADAPAAPPARPPDFPTGLRGPEAKRARERRTLDRPHAAVTAGPGVDRPAEEDQGRRDPFLVALPVQAGEPVLVFEANALRHSRLGQLFVQCALAEDPRFFEEATRATGVDPLKDIDRVGFAGKAMVVSGFFDRARWDELTRRPGTTVEPYGDGGRIIQGAGDPLTVGVWRDQLVVLGDGPAAARQAIDQLEGRAPAPPQALPEELAYGEVYGVIPGEAVQRLFSQGDQALGARLAAAARRVELHVDAMQDVAAVVRVEGDDAGALSDLARTMGGALAAGRLQAQAGGDGQLGELLDSARIVTGDGRFSMELALPASTLERWFEGCAGRRRAAPAAPP